MPIYEYHCSKCGDFETMQRMSDKPLTHCPTCRRKVTKLISSTTFQLKGSGWYITDYARKGDSGGGKGEKKGDDKKSDAKDAGTASDSSADTSSDSTKGSDSKNSDKGSGKKSEKAAVA
jgi:putative FmdB family regulatory protein